MATVRSVREEELDELLDLYRMLNPDDPELARDEALRRQWDAMLADDSLDVLVAEQGDGLVASCLLSITPNLTRTARPFGVLENVVTHEDHRGDGHGKRVVEAAIERARERDCYKVMLLTGTEREWKLAFYESCGFDRDAKTGFVVDFRD